MDFFFCEPCFAVVLCQLCEELVIIIIVYLILGIVKFKLKYKTQCTGELTGGVALPGINPQTVVPELHKTSSKLVESCVVAR